MRPGVVIDSGVDLPDDLDPVVGQAFEQTIEAFSLAPAAFPDEPVGVGATWTSVAATPATDLATASVSEVVTTITAIDGSLVTTTATADPPRARSEPVDYPGVSQRAPRSSCSAARGRPAAITTMDLDQPAHDVQRPSASPRPGWTSGSTVSPSRWTTVTTVEMTMTSE